MTSGRSALPLSHSAFPLGTLLLLMAICFLSHLNRASITTAADERIIGQFNVSPQQMGTIYSAYLLIYTIFMIPGGFFIDRVGPRFALFAMGVSSAVFGALTGVIGWVAATGAQLWISMLVIRSLMGFCTTPLHPGLARAVSLSFPEQRRSLANGLVTSAALLAYAFVHPIFGALMDWVNWPLAFVITGGCLGGVAVLWFAQWPDDSKNSLKAELQTSSSERRSILDLFKNRSLILLTLSYGAVGYFQYLFFYWLHYYFDSVLHLGKTDSRYYAGLPSFAMAVCMPLGGWLSDRAERIFKFRRSSILVPFAGMIASGLLLVLGIISRDIFWIVLWFTVSLGVLGLCEGAFWTTAVQIGASRGATAAAIMNTSGNGIGLLAPMLTPFIAERLSWAWGLGLGSMVAVLGGACWWWVEPKVGRDSVEP